MKYIDQITLECGKIRITRIHGLPINDIHVHVHTEDINKSNGNQWGFFHFNN